MKAKSRPVIALTAALLLLCGCATKPPTAQEKVAVWLAESPRTIAVGAQAELPQPRVHTRDHQAGKRVGKAAAAAGYGILQSCFQIPLVGCVLGLALAPVMAVAGAASVDSIDVYHATDAVKGGDALFEVARQSDLPKLLAEVVVAQQPKAGGHQLRIAERNAPDNQESGSLRIALHTLQLSGETGEKAAVALGIEVSAEMHTPDAIAGLRQHYTYTGSSRRVSEWAAADARLFREEIAIAIRTIATEIVNDIRSTPSASVVTRVQTARAGEK